MQWLAGMRITADRMNDNSIDEETVAGAVAATGFSIVDFSGRKVNGITTITLNVARTGSLIGETSAGSGNIGDTIIATLPVGWRPPETIETVWSNGFNDGSISINTSGTVTARTTSGSNGMDSATNPRITASWISEND